ncbi:helix-turn-helix domain-containing protein [Conexibacter sp. CPCC 206217]|uniref:helix-turn-helix domain-containing protein n=1 Tax=Conexibacter sp. CPCC 206217 TaxID=3064574 RepID=UPI002725BDF5|nr:AraC family transcriptional regulator [Conexibacter sp. CPCC 206217]MDO8210348.1 AraC family transcriptional regulator [Conexibacter sp. CPCC 206217]
MADRLRELIDLVLGSLDEPAASGRELAERAHFSRDHLDRLLAAATGESPVGLRRRLLLERAAWQLRVAGEVPSAVAPAAGYGSLAAFSRAFSRAYDVAPSAFAASAAPVALEAPNGIHFHPPAGLLIPGAPLAPRGAMAGAAAGSGAAAGFGAAARQPLAPLPLPLARDLTDRLVAHHLDRVRELLRAAATVPPEELARALRPGLVILAFEGEEASAGVMAQRLVFTLEVWVAAMAGEVVPEPFGEPAAASEPAGRGEPRAVVDLLDRFERAARTFTRIVRAIRDRGAWDDAFVDALCEPPQSFTYGGVVAHVLSYGAIRRETLAGVLRELGIAGLASGDPIEWEQDRQATRR